MPKGKTTDTVSAPLEAPRYSCATGGVLATLLNINGCIPIMHSGPGCAVGQTVGYAWGSGYQGVGYIGGNAIPCSNLAEKDVVFGGEARLREQIRSTLDLIDGDFYVVVNSCIPSMTGDDIRQVVKEFEHGDAPVYYVDVAGFSGSSYLGFDRAMKSLVEQAVTKKPRKKPGLVNILGIPPHQDLFWRGNLREIKRILARLGLEANVVFKEENGLQSVRRLAEAALTIVISPWAYQETADLLKNRFGIPYVRFPYLPVGPARTTELLKVISGHVPVPKDQLQKVIDEEEKGAYELLDSAADIVSSFICAQPFAIVADASYAVGLSKFLVDEAGAIPQIAIITDNPPENFHDAIERDIKDNGSPLKPKVFFEPDSYKAWELLKKEQLNLLLGSSLDKYFAKDIGATHLSVSYPSFDRLIVERSYAGYRGGTVLLEDIMDKMAKPV